jgi:hypothetical protein
VHAEKLTRLLKGRVVCKHRFEPGDPVAALAGLAVRNTFDARAERALTFSNVLRARHRHAANEIDVAPGHGCLPLVALGRN